MRRFERLRKLARQLASDRGHDLGQFRKTPVIFSDPRNMRGLVRKNWWYAECINCQCEVMINCEVDPINKIGTDVFAAPIETRAILFALKKNNEAQDKLPFPKRAKGSICGKALERNCIGKNEYFSTIF